MSDDNGFFPAYVPDKDELKARLPLTYVCAQLGIALDREGRALCPWHERDGGNHDPSFYLWEGDDGLTRFCCQPCGLGGDLFELLQRYEGLTFTEGVKRAADIYAHMPTDWATANPAPTVVRPDFRTEWEAHVNTTRVYAFDRPGLLSVIAGLVPDTAPEQEALEFDSHLRSKWGWGMDANFNVYLPHFDKTGVMTGCKVRRGESKDSLGGSKYDQFYGSWLTRTTRDVLLTEGETDCVYADFRAAKEGIPITVYALPRGATSASDQWITALTGAGTIYLAFDPDDKGIEATRVWLDLLANAGFTDLRVCSLPRGKDIKSARPALAHLLAGAMHPVAEPDNIVMLPGGYERMNQQGVARSVTNWTIEPKARLIGGEEPGYDVHLTHRGNVSDSIIRLTDLANVNKLKAWCNKPDTNRPGLIFSGNQGDVEAIASLVFARGSITPEIFQADQVGIQPPPPAYEFLGPTMLYPDGYEGQLPWRYVPTGRTANVAGRVRLPVRVTEPPSVWKWRWLEDFLALSAPEVTHPLLAWVIASARRREAAEFPLMFIGGSSGVGKSTLARHALRLAGSEIEIDLGASTPFILIRTLAATTNIPVFVDEWTRMSRRDTREAFQSFVPALYAGGIAERGMSDLGAQAYNLTAPVIVAGEDTFALDRETDRIISISPTRDAQNLGAHVAIEKAPLETFARLYHRWLVSNPPGLPSVSFAAASRPQHNRDVLLAGWETLRLFMERVAEHDASVPELPAVPDLSCFERSADERDGDNVYEQAIQEGLLMRDGNGAMVVWPDPAGMGTWVRAKVLVKLIEQRTDIEMPGRSRAMLNYFRERYSIKVGPCRPPMATQECWASLVVGLHTEIEIGPDAATATPV